jgi:hypothetical protein
VPVEDRSAQTAARAEPCDINCPSWKTPVGPLVRHGVKQATDNELVVQRWWSQRPSAAIGIACGDASGFFVVDVDPRNGGDKSLAALEATHGALPPTVRALTGGGGVHILFRHARGTSYRKNLATGIDLKGTNGYVVASPSPHPSGQLYAWVHDSHPLRTEIAEAPDWLHDLAIAPTVIERIAPPAAYRTPTDARERAYAESALQRAVATVSLAPPGTRNDVLVRESYNIGQLVGGGLIDEERAVRMLFDAALVADPQKRGNPHVRIKIEETIDRGLTAGRRKPRGVPPPRTETGRAS